MRRLPGHRQAVRGTLRKTPHLSFLRVFEEQHKNFPGCSQHPFRLSTPQFVSHYSALKILKEEIPTNLEQKYLAFQKIAGFLSSVETCTKSLFWGPLEFSGRGSAPRAASRLGAHTAPRAATWAGAGRAARRARSGSLEPLAEAVRWSRRDAPADVDSPTCQRRPDSKLPHCAAGAGPRPAGAYYLSGAKPVASSISGNDRHHPAIMGDLDLFTRSEQQLCPEFTAQTCQ